MSTDLTINEEMPRSVPGVQLWLVLWKAQRSLQAVALHHISTLGLGITDFAILEVLLHKGPLPVNVLGQKVMLTSGSITLGVDRLEREGLVERQPSPNDRRIRTVNLTQKGHQLIESTFHDHAAVMQQAVTCLSDQERATLVHLLKRLGLYAEDLLHHAVRDDNET